MQTNSHFKAASGALPSLNTVSFAPAKSYSSTVDFHKKKFLETTHRRNDPSFLKTSITTPDSTYHNLALSLDEWDKKHVKQTENQKGNFWRRRLERRSTKLILDSKIDTINFKTQVSKDVQILRSMKTIRHLENFYKDIEEEKSNILAQNMSVGKKRFNFEIFKGENQRHSSKQNIVLLPNSPTSPNNKNEEQDFHIVGGELCILKKIKHHQDETKFQLQDVKDTDEITIDNRALRQNNLKFKGKYEQVISKDNYKDIITEKYKLERMFHNQIANTIKKIKSHNERIDQIEQEIQDINEQYTSSKQQYTNYKEAYESFLTEADKKIGTAKNFFKNFSEVSNIHSKKKEAKDELKKRFVKFKACETEYTIKIPKLRYSLKEAKNDIKALQQLYNKLIIESRSYYYNLLQEGIDVRDSGLSWIIYKLYELDADVKIEHFPKFVDFPSFKYLVEYSKKRFILAKLNTLMSSIKKNFVNWDIINSPRQKESRIQTKNGKRKVLSKDELISLIEDFNRAVKDKNLVVLSETEITDIENTKKALRYIKSISQGIDNGFSREIFPTLDLFEEERKKFNNMFKTYGLNKEAILNVLVFIKEKINKIEKEMNDMKKAHQKYLKKKHAQNKTKSISDCVIYDLMYAALFGNHVIL
jgi:K+/H+ antiporter YhaU regulatory subunit KhtT